MSEPTPITCKDFDVSCMVFDNVKKMTGGGVEYKQIPIKYINKNKKTEGLFIETEDLISYGIKENAKSFNVPISASNPLVSYSLPLIVDDPDLIRVLQEIIDACQEHLKDPKIKKSIGKHGLPNLTKLFYYKTTDDGEIEEGSHPTIYPKLFAFPNDSGLSITTKILDTNIKEINPMDILNTRCKVRVLLRVFNIYIGASPSIQLKAANVEVVEILPTLQIMLKKKVRSVLEKDEDKTDSGSESENEETPKIPIMRRR